LILQLLLELRSLQDGGLPNAAKRARSRTRRETGCAHRWIPLLRSPKPARSPSTELKGARPMRGSDAQSRHYQSLTVTIASLLRLRLPFAVSVLFIFPAGSFEGAAADSVEGRIRFPLRSCKQPPPISRTTFWPLDSARPIPTGLARTQAVGECAVGVVP
jgi:hypothetical protein